MTKRRIQAAIIGSVVLVAPLTTRAQIVTTIFDYGSCGQFLQVADEERKAKPLNAQRGTYWPYAAYRSYAEGFLTGANWAAATRSDQNDSQVGSSSSDHFVSAMAWLENYCRQNPLNEYSLAVEALRIELKKREQQSGHP